MIIFYLKSALNRGISKNIKSIKGIEILERPLDLTDYDDFKSIDPN